MLSASITKRLREYSLEADLTVAAGEGLVLVGESGSGKTTLLRLLAGLARPDRGRITLDESTLFDGDSGDEIPAEERPVGFVAQDYALFPHLSVHENVAFGLRARGERGPSIAERVRRELAALGIEAQGPRLPGELSGGQQQRVALARALVLEPRLLLLDEPLSALDPATRRAVRAALRRRLAERPCITVYVTHQPSEALAFGDRIAVVERGRITQQGSPEDLVRRPRSAYVAAFLGINLIAARVVERSAGALARVRAGSAELRVSDPEREGDLLLMIRPSEITLSLEPPAGSARNVIHGSIEEIVPEAPAGERARVFLASDPPLVAEVSRDAAEMLALAPGRAVYAAFKATGVTVVD